MDMENLVYCHWDLVRFVTEEKLIRDGIFKTLSVTANDVLELRMYLGKNEQDGLFEVRIYKTTPKQVYAKNGRDQVLFYDENDEYATFQFEDFEDARDFLSSISDRHPEYRYRPMRRLPRE